MNENELNKKIDELTYGLEKLSEKQNSQYTDIMLLLKEIQGGLGNGEVIYRSSDDLYEEAREAVVEHGKASTSFIQRILHIGYSRAVHIIDELEKNGVVGPADGVKTRDVLIKE